MATQPVNCPVTQNFGDNPASYKPFGLNGHEGRDYGCNTGTPVYNAKAGVVGVSSMGYGNYGRCIVVRTINGEGLIYAHLLRFVVAAGQAVAEGQLIGYTDNTGNSTGPHLHFGYQPAYMSNLNNGYFGCANPDVLLRQGESMGVPESAVAEIIKSNQAAARKARRSDVATKYRLLQGRDPEDWEVDHWQDTDPEQFDKAIRNAPETKNYNPTGYGASKNGPGDSGQTLQKFRQALVDFVTNWKP